MGQYEEFWTRNPPRPNRKTLTLHYDEGIFVGYRHFDSKIDPRFPFGFGLSYTTFEWNEFYLDQQTGDENTTLNFSMRIKNPEKSQTEMVQTYLEDQELKFPT